jgi:hypothetical protein
MDRPLASPVYTTILGRNPRNPLPHERPIVISLTLPRLGEHDFKWVIAETLRKEYGHYGFKLHPKANPTNVHVYGERELIMHLAKSGNTAKCELELVVKKTTSGREFILVNLYLTKPWLRETHAFTILGTSPDAEKRPWFVYTTKDMCGTGISVEPL